MHIQLTKERFIDEWNNSERGNSWSYEGLVCLFYYLEDYEGSSDTSIEFDLIALDCEFYEVEKEYHYKQYDREEDAEELIVEEFLSDDGVEMLLVREG